MSVYSPTMRRDSRIADLGRGRGDARVRETGNALAKERDQPHRLPARFDLRARQIVGIERIDVDDARHVHRHFVGIRRDEERDEFARHVDAVRLRGLPQLVEPGDGGQRAAACVRRRSSDVRI